MCPDIAASSWDLVAPLFKLKCSIQGIYLKEIPVPAGTVSHASAGEHPIAGVFDWQGAAVVKGI